jgi:ribose 5-phosphate isomerase RpiB
LKVYIIGDASEDIEDAVSILENKNISVIAKEASDFKQLSNYIEDTVSKGDSRIIIIVKDPLQSSISLNKSSSINAALCSTSDDVALAYKSGANAIILKDSNEKEDVLEAIINSSAADVRNQQPQAQANVDMQKKKKKMLSRVDEEYREYNKTEKTEEQATEQQANANEQEKGEQSSNNSKGLFGGIKDALGIVSVKKEQKAKSKKE